MAEACFLLVPGAGGDSWYWHRAAAELRARGHRVIAVDLPAGDDTAGFTEYADAVLASASAAGIDAGWRGELVLVAQSMAGFLAPVLCERLPVTQLVLLNAMIPVPGETFGEWWHNTGSGEARRELDLREGRPTDAEFDPVVYFLHDLPPELVEQAMREEPRQSDTVFDQAAPSTNWRSGYWSAATTGSSPPSSSAPWPGSDSGWPRRRSPAATSPRSATPPSSSTSWRRTSRSEEMGRKPAAHRSPRRL
jgi:pimeloyl-ACP methyl ester carboxylesterase